MGNCPTSHILGANCQETEEVTVVTQQSLAWCVAAHLQSQRLGGVSRRVRCVRSSLAFSVATRNAMEEGYVFSDAKPHSAPEEGTFPGASSIIRSKHVSVPARLLRDGETQSL